MQSDVNPGDYYLVDTQTRNAQYLRSARSWVDPERMRHKESIELKSRDGKTLHGYLTRPKDATYAAGCPLAGAGGRATGAIT